MRERDPMNAIVGAPLRRIDDRDAARAQGLSRVCSSTSDVSKRHDVHAHQSIRQGSRRSSVGIFCIGMLCHRLPADLTNIPSTLGHSTIRAPVPPRMHRASACARDVPCSTKLLVTAAVDAGRRVAARGGAVMKILIEGGKSRASKGRAKGNHPFTQHARVAIGADGMRSLVAKDGRPRRATTRVRPSRVGYYAVLEPRLPAAGIRSASAPASRLRALAPPTNGLTMAVVNWAASGSSRTGATWRAT